jgi:hypothetical protein
MGLLASDCNYSEVSVDEHDSDSTPSVHKGPPCVPIHTEPYPLPTLFGKGGPLCISNIDSWMNRICNFSTSSPRCVI